MSIENGVYVPNVVIEEPCVVCFEPCRTKPRCCNSHICDVATQGNHWEGCYTYLVNCHARCPACRCSDIPWTSGLEYLIPKPPEPLHVAPEPEPEPEPSRTRRRIRKIVAVDTDESEDEEVERPRRRTRLGNSVLDVDSHRVRFPDVLQRPAISCHLS